MLLGAALRCCSVLSRVKDGPQLPLSHTLTGEQDVRKRYGRREFRRTAGRRESYCESTFRIGRNFDPASHDDFDRVVQYVSELMANDRAMYDELVTALIRTEDSPQKA
jgi:hypothetical protein